MEVLRERSGKKDCVAEENKNEELGNDVTEVLCISSDSDVSLCFPVSEFPALECLRTDSGCMCVSALSAAVCVAILRKACWSASGTQISSKEGRHVATAKEILVGEVQRHFSL